MLYISRWKAAAILLTAFICCLFAVPNFFPEKTVQRWPAWAQRHIVLGLDLQGGSHILLQVDTNDVRRQKLQALQDDVRKLLREARVGLTRAPVIRGNSVEVVVRDSDVQQALTKLRDLSQPLHAYPLDRVRAPHRQCLYGRIADSRQRRPIGQRTHQLAGMTSPPARVARSPRELHTRGSVRAASPSGIAARSTPGRAIHIWQRSR